MAGVKRNRNEGIEIDDPRYRWDISYVAGIRTREEDQRVEYKVVWKSAEFREGAAEFQWMTKAQMDGTVNIDEFHERYMMPDPINIEGFPWGLTWEFDLPLAMKNRAGTVSYKCPHCEYSHEKRSNVDVHIVGVHQKCPALKCVCDREFGTKSNFRRHIKTCREFLKMFD